RRAAEQRDELAPLHCSAPASVKGLNSLRLRRGLPCHKLPSLRRLGPDAEKFEPEAARLAVNLGLYRRPACDGPGFAVPAHLTGRKAGALILGLARSHRFEPGRLGVSDGGGVGVEKLIVCKPLHSLPVFSNHRRKPLIFQGKNFLFTAHSIPPSRYRRPSNHHSITSSARASNLSGTVRPSAFAVLRLITSSYFVGASTGRSAAFFPFRVRS